MIEQNPERKNKIKKNITFLILVIVLSLIAWFGVKMLVSGPSATSSLSSAKKSNSLIQTGFGGGGTPPADAGGGGYQRGAASSGSAPATK